jgi:hypothetical protein
MQNLPSYQTQFNKITEAYIRGEIKPLDAHFCFCGTLCDNIQQWYQPYRDFKGYTAKEFKRMEDALFVQIRKTTGESVTCTPKSPLYEDGLFNGMVAALNVLRQIHIEHGEIIDQSPVFQKRELVNL